MKGLHFFLLQKHAAGLKRAPADITSPIATQRHAPQPGESDWFSHRENALISASLEEQNVKKGK